MPETIRYLSVHNDQQPAGMFTRNYNEHENQNYKVNPTIEHFVTEVTHKNHSCYVWNTNVLLMDSWQAFDCQSRVAHPFVVCKRKNSLSSKMENHQRPRLGCIRTLLMLNQQCIRISNIIKYPNKMQHYGKLQLPVETDPTRRVLSAWTLPLYEPNFVETTTIRLQNWKDTNECECYESRDLFYVEMKMWYKYDNYSCQTNQLNIVITDMSESIIPEMMFSCKDGNYIHKSYVCDGQVDCKTEEDEEKCTHVCSSQVNCTKSCTLPDCVCMSRYHQCVHGGCVQQTFVCDGTVNCPNDDSDELLCNSISGIQEHIIDEYHQHVSWSFCNSFSKERYPSNAICLLERDHYGVTKYCTNTEHLHYCTDFICPKHYKCLQSYCIPLHSVCDGIKDCPQGQEEDNCSGFVCRGYIRCKAMDNCLHPDKLCNGIVDCPVHGDDEKFCGAVHCPQNCECVGFTIICAELKKNNFNYASSTDKRVVIIFNSTIYCHDLQHGSSRRLHILNLTKSAILPHLSPDDINNMPDLRVLVLDTVNMVGKQLYQSMNSLSYLYISSVSGFTTITSDTFQLPSLISMNIRKSGMQEILENAFCHLDRLKYLNISMNKIKTIYIKTFACLDSIINLDISHNPLLYIEQSAFIGFALVSVSKHRQLCCFIGQTTDCQVNNNMISSVERTKQCQPILTNYRYLKTIYGCIGLSTIIISIIFLIKVTRTHEQRARITTYITCLTLTDLLNGLFLTTVMVSDSLANLLAGNIMYKELTIRITPFIAVIPKMSLVIARSEHLVLTMEMYESTCNIFQKSRQHIQIVRLVLWIVSICYTVLELTHLNTIRYKLQMWLPYYMIDHGYRYIVSIVFVVAYDSGTCALIYYLFYRIYKAVYASDQKIKVKRLSKCARVLSRLTHLAIGRATVLIVNIIMITITTQQHIPQTVKQLYIALALPTSMFVNFVLYYK